MSSATYSPNLDRSSVQPATGALPAIRVWLATMAVLVFVMVLVGGATRLTDSGLSITEWRPLMGAIPPFSEAAWMLEFEKYRQIPQYQLLNRGMSLAEFKFIYWWEWGHRQFGRFIGIAWFVPLAWFAWRGHLRGRLLAVLALIGALGGLQGAIGWLMVNSGLQPGMVAVAPIKLTLHLSLACVIFASIIRMLALLSESTCEVVPAQVVFGARLLVAALFGQIALGGLVAGLDAGLAFNTWPLMDGRLMPDFGTLFAATPWLQNLVANVALVQFNHRTGAYLLLALALWHLVSTMRSAPRSAAARRALLLAALVLAQGVLGIVTLLLAVPLWAGLAHQGFAIMLLGAAVWHATQGPRSSRLPTA